MFKILKRDNKSKARLGVLTTPHGRVLTPSYVFVGTYGRFLHLTPADIKKTKSQIFIANTFHLWKKALQNKLPDGFIHKSFGMKIPVMTDSGGFQVLSLAFGDKNKVGKFMVGNTKPDASYKRSKIRITQKGVHFNFKGKKLFLGPELSMKLQRKIGADIIFAFDQITSPLDDFEYNRKAVRMTNRWAHLCLNEHAKSSRLRERSGATKQQLFGIVQGGLFPDLRKQSAKYIGSLPFDGFGIGGSYTKKQISKMLKWVIPYLPDEKPRHLLGVGKIEDVFEAIENGIDTFDCVIPTREARHGRLYTRDGHMDIRRGRYTKDKKVIERKCGCPTCASGISCQQIRESLKGQPSHLVNEVCNCRRQSLTRCEGQRWCLMHNMWFFNNFLKEIRTALANGSYHSYKKRFLKRWSRT